MTSKYCLVSGMFGCMPDRQEVYDTEEEAKEALKDWVDLILDEEATRILSKKFLAEMEENGVTWSKDLMYVTFNSHYIQGIDYAEINEVKKE